MKEHQIQSKTTMLFAALFLGALGVHRYMMGYGNWWKMALTLGGFGLWSLVDFYRIFSGKMKMVDGEKLL